MSNDQLDAPVLFKFLCFPRWCVSLFVSFSQRRLLLSKFLSSAVLLYQLCKCFIHYRHHSSRCKHITRQWANRCDITAPQGG